MCSRREWPSSLRGVFSAHRFARPKTSDAGIRRLGTHECIARPGDRVVHDTRVPLRRAVGPSGAALSSASRDGCDSPLAPPSLPPISGGGRDRVHASPRDGRRASTIRGVFHRQATRARAHVESTSAPPRASSITRRSRDEDRRVPTNHLPLPKTRPHSTYVRGSSSWLGPAFTPIRRRRPSFRPGRCRWCASRARRL